MSLRRLAAACAALVVLAGPGAAYGSALTPAQPLLLYGDESVASTDDARAYLTNPAAIGQRYPSELLLAWARRDPEHEWNTGVGTWRRLAFAPFAPVS